MKQSKLHNLPKARRSEILTREIPGELLVYDMKRHRAYCLNETAAYIWKQCNGKRTVAQLACQLEDRSGGSVDEKIVWLALDQLEKRHLLDPRFSFPSQSGVSRRGVIRSIGLASVIALPVVVSIIAPTAVQAASCIPGGIPTGSCTGVTKVGCCCTNSKTCAQTGPTFKCDGAAC